jgi:sigma-B regulation protein RsbU (phosphoserine phosphatase)
VRSRLIGSSLYYSIVQRPRDSERAYSPGLYVLLGLYVAVTLTYQMVASVSLIVGYFDLRQQVQSPFEIEFMRPVISSVTDDAKRRGLTKGDAVLSINDEPYRGREVWQRQRWYAHAGDVWRIRVRQLNGMEATAVVPLKAISSRKSGNRAVNEPQPGEASFVVFIQIVVPLFCLALGYWVALARPRDPNAWFILVLLSYPEAFISVSTLNWWPGIWLPLRLIWHISLEVLAPAALLFLGLLFPERSRIDTKFPWFKWLVLAVLSCSLAAAIADEYSAWYAFGFIPNLTGIDHMNDRVDNWAILLCIAIYWISLFDKMRSASNPDSRRRLRVLCAGSVVGLGSVLIIFGLLPMLGIADPSSRQWLGYLSAVLMLAFPLSLAYVVVVQRAMDVQILLRMGTKYALARSTVWILRTALLILIGIYLWQTARAPHFDAAVIVRLVVLALLLTVVSPRIFEPISKWIDRRFFREAYSAELVLNELSESVRTIVESRQLLETVGRKISDSLHVARLTILVNSGVEYQVQYAVGFETPPLRPLSGNGYIANRLQRERKPQPVYYDDSQSWIYSAEGANEAERGVLQALDAQLLLPLAFKEKLEGIIALGPKLSEEPYAASDVRLLESVAAQTGLALENSRLTHAIASEVARRESAAREMEIAKAVQSRLFPQHCPNIPGLDCVGRCCPALEVGGDYYDWTELPGGELGIAIGDICGKGVPAALLMASLQASFRAITLAGISDLADLMGKLNLLMYDASPANRFATVFCCVYDAPSGLLRYSSAGHNPALLIRANSKEPAWLRTPGTALGLRRKSTFEQAALILAEGDRLVLYTDGVTEARNVEGDEFGEQRLFETIRAAGDCSASEMVDHVLETVHRFAAGTIQHDDITLIAAVRH